MTNTEILLSAIALFELLLLYYLYCFKIPKLNDKIKKFVQINHECGHTIGRVYTKLQEQLRPYVRNVNK